jgi:hypothetical protein
MQEKDKDSKRKLRGNNGQTYSQVVEYADLVYALFRIS